MLQFLKMPIYLLNKKNKTVQAAGAVCLARVIQNSPEQIVEELLEDICERIITIMRAVQFKAHAALLETLISVIFHIEDKIQPFTEKLLEVIMEQVSSEDQSTKKIAIDGIYSLTATVQDHIVPHRMQILQSIKDFRCHKVKPVREAAG